jgi:excisionase family DNA binding protein
MDTITTDEAARRLGVSPRRVQFLIATGRIKAKRFGDGKRAVFMVDAKSVAAWKPLPAGRPPQKIGRKRKKKKSA